MSESANCDDLQVRCVHGRFQPFHLGHFEYVLRALQSSSLLYVGLANSDPSHIDNDPASSHRHLQSANPFPYFIRMEMVLGALMEYGVDLTRIRITPFPINRLELLQYYVPAEAIHMMTIFDDWGQRKLRTLTDKGLKVEVISMRKVTTGTDVRDLILRGESISHLVPPFVDDYLRKGANRFVLGTA